jgi:hypothetical protein
LQTIRATFTRDQFSRLPKTEHAGIDTKAGEMIAAELLRRGVPVIGHIGVLAVEWGKLTISHEEGLDGDEWTYTWTGEPVPAEFVKRMNGPNGRLILVYPLRARIAIHEATETAKLTATVEDDDL